MNVLAFDTCFDACSVAAGRALRSLSPSIVSLFATMQSGQAECLMPMIEEALDVSRLRIADLDVIAVTSGPGTFTGTRITAATARALSLFAKTPIVAVSTLKLMAMSSEANATGAQVLAIATDARRDEVYFEAFDAHSLASIAGPQVLSISEAALNLGPKPAVVAGSGAINVARVATQLGTKVKAIAPGLLPDAIDMLFAVMEMPRVNIVQPLYLRPPDAKPQVDAALART